MPTPHWGLPHPRWSVWRSGMRAGGVIKGLNRGSSRSDSSQLERAGASLERHSISLLAVCRSPAAALELISRVPQSAMGELRERRPGLPLWDKTTLQFKPSGSHPAPGESQEQLGVSGLFSWVNWVKGVDGGRLWMDAGISSSGNRVLALLQVATEVRLQPGGAGAKARPRVKQGLRTARERIHPKALGQVGQASAGPFLTSQGALTTPSLHFPEP